MKLDARRRRQREPKIGHPGHGSRHDRISQTARVIEERTDGPSFGDSTFVVESPGELGGVPVFIGPTEENGEIVFVMGSGTVAFRLAVLLVLCFLGMLFLLRLFRRW